MPSHRVPAYRLHKPSGRAVVTIPLGGGRRRDVYLGAFNSPPSRKEYARIVAELATAAAPGQVAGAGPDPTVNEVMLAFWRHAQAHYRRADGTPTNELMEYRQSLRPLKALYGHTPAREFGPLALKAVRSEMIKLGLCRGVVNNRVRRIVHVFKWAVAEQLAPAAVHQSLKAVTGLQRGRSGVRDREPVGPVEGWAVRYTLPHLLPEVAAMVEVQSLTGMRPGEVCQLRPADLDVSGPVWLYRPQQHKTQWRGRPRVIAIGPKAQEVLERHRPADPADYFFSPARAVEALHAGRSERRATPRWPSHLARNERKRVKARRRPPAACYTTAAYDHAVARAVGKANQFRRVLPAGAHGPAEPEIPRWTPNQLRHAHATEVRRRYGLEAAGASLGHSKMSATEVYAERDLGLATRVALELG